MHQEGGRRVLRLPVEYSSGEESGARQASCAHIPPTCPPRDISRHRLRATA